MAEENGAGTASSSPRTAAANGARSTRARSSVRRRTAQADDDLEAQVAQLQKDIRDIAQSLTRMGENKVTEARKGAMSKAADLRDKGEEIVENVQDEFGAVEKQVKDAIREKPLTAIAGALAIGYVIAAITR